MFFALFYLFLSPFPSGAFYFFPFSLTLTRNWRVPREDSAAISNLVLEFSKALSSLFFCSFFSFSLIFVVVLLLLPASVVDDHHHLQSFNASTASIFSSLLDIFIFL
ncbi:unnamed protein product [Meloidogyne enterolobii]|uniref:Uncharacterized protein n=1 Tax=Meloidogyne enterolobii TaxID=390850 RepID=A0ACB0ZJN2_MELEN